MAKLRFNLQAGLLVRGSVRRSIKALAARHGLKLQLDEEKGWLSSSFTVSAKGTERGLVAFGRAIRELCKELE